MDFQQVPSLTTMPVLPDRFQVLGELGRGGMAVVYHAKNLIAHREVAIKLLPPTTDDASLRRFQREAADLAAVFHPNVVCFYGLGGADGHEFIEMEYVGGGSVTMEICAAMTMRMAIELFLGICAGLEHIHNRGLVHRDLKLQNILVSMEGVPKIADLGLARRIEGYGERSQLTSDGAVLGTVAYMAPEQLVSSDVGPPADLYALGICLYQAFTGQHPFNTESQPALLRAQLEQIPRSPLELRPDLPVRLATLILSLLEKSPDKRPRSAAVVATTLQRCLEDLSIRPDTSVQAVLQGRTQDIGDLADLCLQGIGLLLVAPAEVGRSRLLEEVSTQLGSRGLSPYMLTPGVELTSIFSALGAPPEEVTRLFFAGGPELVAGGLRRRLQEASTPGKPGTKARQPAILLGDDLERLDPFAQAVMERLMHLTPPERSGWILSVTQAQAFALPEQPKRYELGPLKDPDIKVLAEATLKGQLSVDLSNWLVPRAGGSPRQLKLLISALRADDLLEAKGGWVGLAANAAPPINVVDSILAEVERLDEDTRTILRTAALLREPFLFSVISEASGLSEERADKTLEGLVRTGLIEETGEQFRFASPQLRRRLSGDLSDRVRRRFHARLAEVVHETEERGRHLALAGQNEDAANLLSEAAQSAHDRGLYVDACSLWEAAANCVNSVEAAVGKARAEAAAGMLQEALDGLSAYAADPEVQLCQAEIKLRQGAFEDAYSLCKAIGTPDVQPLLATVYEHQGNDDAAGQALTRALAENPSDAARLRERLARLQMRQGKTAEALKCAKLNLDQARTPDEKLRSLELLAEVERKPERLAEALQLTEQAGWPDESARLEMLRADMSENAGDLPAALAGWLKAVELLRPFGESSNLVQALTRLGQTHQAVSRVNFAEGALRESVSCSDATGDKDARSRARRGLGTFLLENNNLEEASKNLQQAVDLVDGGPALAEALSELSVCHRLQDQADSALLSAEKAVAVARPLPDKSSLCKALVTLGEACLAKKKWKTGLESLQEAQSLTSADHKLYPRLMDALAQLNAQGAQQEYPGLSTVEADRFRRIAQGLRTRGRTAETTPASRRAVASGGLRLPGKPSRPVWAIPVAIAAVLTLGLTGSHLLGGKPAHLHLESTPEGAAVTIAQLHGVTPCNLDVPAGTYPVNFESKGYQDHSESVTLQAGQTTSLQPHLTASSGSISLTSVPTGATVFVNNKIEGITPCNVSDLPLQKQVEVKLSKAGYLPTSSNFTVSVGDRTLALALAKIPETPKPVAPKPKLKAAPKPVAAVAAPVHLAPRPIYHAPTRPLYHSAPHHSTSHVYHAPARHHRRHNSALDSIIHRMATGKE